MKTVIIYTDGACSGNPGPGGWGAVLKYGEHRRELCGGEKNTTNNRMELTAVIESLSALKEPCIVELYSDSKYIIDAVTKGWAVRWRENGWKRNKKEDALNPDLWQKLLEHEIDILVCTTIIETGVDVPNANTLIIEDADRFGLSQLHQLRGRVGRSPRRAYAYFCFRRGRELSEVASKRLEAIRQFTEFGSGFKIAMRDLEIRGAGSILGGEQHGNMEAVGYDMYLKLLAEAVNEEKGIESYEDLNCTIDLNISAHIPEHYIESLPARLGIYRRIADIRDDGDAADVIDELCDRFGEPPRAVMGLIEISLLRSRASGVGITEITGTPTTAVLHTIKIDEKVASCLADEFKSAFTLSTSGEPAYIIRLANGLKLTDVVSRLSKIL